MTASVEELIEQFDTEEQACVNAQRRIDNSGVVGRLIGKYQKWVHTGELRQIIEEIDVSELHQRLNNEQPTAV